MDSLYLNLTLALSLSLGETPRLSGVEASFLQGYDLRPVRPAQNEQQALARRGGGARHGELAAAPT